MLCNQFSIVSGSDSRFIYLPTPSISSAKSFKFSSIPLPSRSSSFKLMRVSCVVDPPCSYSSSDDDGNDDHLSFCHLPGVPDIKQAYKELARKHHDHAMAELKKQWRAQWQAQLEGLNRTTNKRYGDRSQLWAARVRRARMNESLNDEL